MRNDKVTYVFKMSNGDTLTHKPEKRKVMEKMLKSVNPMSSNADYDVFELANGMTVTVSHKHIAYYYVLEDN